MVATGAEIGSEEARLVEAKARVGTTLRGKWRLDSLLGLGGMAAVYAATHRNGIRGAVKVLDPVVAHNDSMRERFLREGYLANSVDHPAAVLVLDDDTTDDGCVYLVMELLDGSTLESLAEAAGGRLPAREVLAATAQLLDALSHAHARSIVHRDIKPDNLFLTTGGTLKVLDFGIARLLESELALSITQTGSPMGTPAFMSPEQARGRSNTVGAQSDLYSVGATMFTLLSGELVHGKDVTISEYVAATFTTQARSLASVAPDVPAPIVAVVDRALRLDKADRWASASAMLHAVREAHRAVHGEELPEAPVPSARAGRSSLVSLHELKSLTPVSKPPQHNDAAPTLAPPPLEPRGRNGLRVALVVGALAVAGGTAFAIARSQRPSELPTSHVGAAIVTARETAPPPLAVSAAPPVVTERAAPPPTASHAETSQGPSSHAARVVRTTQPAPATAAPKSSPVASAAPSATASAAPTPTVDVYDRRY